MKIWSDYCELNQYERLAPIGLHAYCKDDLGNLHRYGCCDDSVDMNFFCSLFMGVMFIVFKNRRSFYIRDS